MHRIRVSLALLIAALLIAGCAQMQQPVAPVPPEPPNALVPPGGPCRASNDADAPVVCVDDSADVLKVDPDPFWIHATPSPRGRGTPAVQWFTRSGRGELKVVFADERCVRNVVCNGGHCTAVASRLDPGEKTRRCKYDVQLTGHPTLDPEGVLTECCVSGGG